MFPYVVNHRQLIPSVVSTPLIPCITDSISWGVAANIS